MPEPDNQNHTSYERRRLAFVLYPAALVLIFASMMIWPPIKRILEIKAEVMQAQAHALQEIPNIDAKLSNLEKRTATLTSDNIEARVARIEKALSIGEIKTNELSTIQQLRDNQAKLSTWMFSTPERLLEFRTLQKDYSDLKAGIDRKPDKDAVQREIETVKNWFYVTLALGGIVATILAAPHISRIANRWNRDKGAKP